MEKEAHANINYIPYCSPVQDRLPIGGGSLNEEGDFY